MAYDEVPSQSQDHTMLAERPSRAGKLVGGISSDGLYTRPSCKRHEEVQLPLEEPKKPGVLPLQIVGKDTEVSSNANVVTSS